MKAETHLDGGCRLSTTAWRKAAPRLSRLWACASCFVRRERRQCRLIDRFFWISRCPVPNVRPIALSDSPRDSDPITAFLGRRKPSTKALRRPVETTLELDIVRRKSALRICARKHRRPGLTKRNALRTFVSTQMAAASKKAHKRDQQKSRPIQFDAEAAARVFL
jgi:hypothetical protein